MNSQRPPPPDSTSERAKFEDGLDRWGPDLSRWPERERRGAEALLSRDARCQALLAETDALWKALAPEPRPVAPDALVRRVLEVPQRHPRATSSPFRWWPFDTAWQPALGLAASLALGVLTGGYFDPSAPGEEQAAESVSTALLGGAAEEFEEADLLDLWGDDMVWEDETWIGD